MKDEKKFSRRRVLATTVAVGCWGGVPGHAWPEPEQGPRSRQAPRPCPGRPERPAAI